MTYLIEFMLIALALYGYYWGFLRQQSWLNVNRAYLLLLLPISAVLASVDWAVSPSWAVLPSINLDPVEIGAPTTAEATVWYLQIENWAWRVYGLGATISAFLFGSRLWKLIRYVARAEKEDRGTYSLVYTTEPWSPASFFTYIFWNPDIPTDRSEAILAHEVCHVKQGHSLDQLLLEIAQCLLWFFPAVYWIRRDLIQTHEFLADKEASRQLDSRTYAQLLLQEGLGVELALAHSFHHSPIKNRIFMLTNPLSKWTPFRYAGPSSCARPCFCPLCLST